MINISKTLSAFEPRSGFNNTMTMDSFLSNIRDCRLHDCQNLHNLPAPQVEELVNSVLEILKAQDCGFVSSPQNDVATSCDVITTALLNEAQQEFEAGWSKVSIDIATDLGGVSFICMDDVSVDLPESLVGDDVTVLQKCVFVSKTFKGCCVFFENHG